MAWMCTTPPLLKGVTRAAHIENRGGTPLFPKLQTEAYLLGYFASMGMVQNTGMGYSPLPATEIYAWQQCTLCFLNPWEFATIREMSRAYCNTYAQAQQNDEFAPPFGAKVVDFDREKMSQKVGNAFKSFILAKKTNG